MLDLFLESCYDELVSVAQVEERSHAYSPPGFSAQGHCSFLGHGGDVGFESRPDTYSLKFFSFFTKRIGDGEWPGAHPGRNRAVEK